MATGGGMRLGFFNRGGREGGEGSSVVVQNRVFTILLCVCAYVCAYVCVCMRVYIHVCVHACLCVCVSVQVCV